MSETLQLAARACADVANWFLFALFVVALVMGLVVHLAMELDRRDRGER